MISALLMAHKQLSEFEKAQIIAYNHYGLFLGNIAKKSNCHYLSVDVFIKNYSWRP